MCKNLPWQKIKITPLILTLSYVFIISYLSYIKYKHRYRAAEVLFFSKNLCISVRYILIGHQNKHQNKFEIRFFCN